MEQLIKELDSLILALTNKGFKSTAKQVDSIKRKVMKEKKISDSQKNEISQCRYVLGTR